MNEVHSLQRCWPLCEWFDSTSITLRPQTPANTGSEERGREGGREGRKKIVKWTAVSQSQPVCVWVGGWGEGSDERERDKVYSLRTKGYI